MKKHYNVGVDNPMCGTHHTGEAKGKMRAAKLDRLNPNWVGDNVSYSALHAWVMRRKAKPLLCELCEKRPPFDLANKDHNYTRDLSEWGWLCRRCHMEIDGRLKRLHILRRQRRWPCSPAMIA